MVEVIVGSPLEQGRRRELEHPIEVGDSPKVPIIARVMDAGIPQRIFAANLRSAIARRVIADQNFEVCESLRQQAVEQLWQKLLPIKDRDSDRELRHRVLSRALIRADYVVYRNRNQ
jgi:hypothetical protein